MSCAGIMLGTLLDLLGVVRGVAWSRPEEDFAGEIGEKEQELPSAIDEKEFEMLMMQAVPGHITSLNESFEFNRLVNMMRVPPPCNIHSLTAHLKIAMSARAADQGGGYDDVACMKYMSSFTLWCLSHGSDLLSSAVASVKPSKSNNHQHHHRHIHKHPSFIDAVTLLTLALRLASNDIHTLTHEYSSREFNLSSQQPSGSSSSAWSSHSRQLPIWANGSGSSLRSKMRAWSLDSLALAAYWLNDFSYSATLLCHALRCEGSSGDDEERCVYSHHLTCCLSMLAKHDHAFTIGRSIQVILKRHLGRLNEQAAGTRGWAAVPWGRGRWGGGGTGTFSWTRERQDRGAAMLLLSLIHI